VGIGYSFLFSGCAVGLLALGFLRWWWRVPRKAAWWVSGLAAVVTNPAWVMLLKPSWLHRF